MSNRGFAEGGFYFLAFIDEFFFGGRVDKFWAGFFSEVHCIEVGYGEAATDFY